MKPSSIPTFHAKMQFGVDVKKSKKRQFASEMSQADWDIIIRKLHMDLSRQLVALTKYWAKELPEYLEDTHG